MDGGTISNPTDFSVTGNALEEWKVPVQESQGQSMWGWGTRLDVVPPGPRTGERSDLMGLLALTQTLNVN